MVIFAIHTAARQSDILRFKKADVDFDRRVVIFRGAKLGESRVVPLSKYAFATLKLNDTMGPYVFPTTRTEITRDWRRLLERAGIRDFKFQDLRHDATARMFARRVSTMRVIFPLDKRFPALPHYTKMDLGYIVERLGEPEKSESALRKAEDSADGMTVSDLAGHVEEAKSIGAPIVPVANGEPTALPGTNSSDVKSTAAEPAESVVLKTRN
jgi:hypothetical protein